MTGEQPAESETITFEVSTSPIFAFARETMLLVGVEDQDDGMVRVYVAARYRGIYLLVDADQAIPFRQAWATGQHAFIAPVPPSRFLHREDVGT